MLETPQLDALLDVQAVQSMLVVFSKLTGVAIGLFDIRGNLYASAGWQDVCTMFHRTHPQTRLKCQESDTHLNQCLKKGAHAAYKCGNAMWDVVTPIYLGDRHIANIFIGQFFYEDEHLDFEFFSSQAEAYGFDCEAYVQALARVPRFGREEITSVMDFLVRFADMLSTLGYANFKLTRTLEELQCGQQRLAEILSWKESILNTTALGILVVARQRVITEVNVGITALFGYTPDEMLGQSVRMLHVDDAAEREFGERYWAETSRRKIVSVEWRMRRKSGEIFWCELAGSAIDIQDIRQGVVWVASDVTMRKNAETALRNEAELMRALFSTSPDALIIVDRNMLVVEANDQFAKLVGRPRDLVVGRYLWDFEARYTRRELERVGYSIGFGFKGPFESEFRRDGGSIVPVELHGRVMRWRDSNWAVYVVRNISKQKADQEVLLEREEIHAAMIKQASVGVLLVDLETFHFVEFNDFACSMLGYNRDEFAKITLLDISLQLNSSERVNHADILKKGVRETFEALYLKKDASILNILISARTFVIKGRLHAVTFWTDITARKAAERALRVHEQEARTLLEHSPDCIIRYDRHLRRLYLNNTAQRFIGAALGKTATPQTDSPNLDMPGYLATLESVFATGLETEMEIRFRYPNGGLGWGLGKFTPEFDFENNVASVLVVIRDITELVRQREELHQLAFYDALTGLPNRALFNDRLQQEVIDRRRRGGKFALMALDIDNFKDINDAMGHAVGDRLLREIGRRLSGVVRDYDTLSRLGGDEFALLLPEIRTSKDMGAVAMAILDALAAPLRIEGRDVFATASIGIAVYPDDTESLEELSAFADAAMYHAKAKGRNNFQFYGARLTQVAQARLSLGGQLRHALVREQLEIYYQPKVSMPDGRLLGAEALLRWNHPCMGVLSPVHFIEIAEDSGLIVDIGHWVLDQACAAVSRWNRSRDVPLRVAVNLSSRQFMRNDLAGSVRQVLAARSCLGSWLELEITERLVLDDDPDIQCVLEAFGAMGASIAIDDFGTGHSALSYLNRFKVDVLKIDRSFITGLEHDRRKGELVKAFIAVARALDMEVVAEGVELCEQVDFLCSNGCFVGQGYFYGRPMPLAEFEKNIE